MQHIHLFSSQMYIDFFLCYGLSCSFESRLHACRMKASNLSNSPFHSSDTRKNLGPKNLLPGPLPMSFAWRLRHTQIKKKLGTYPYPCYCQLVRGMLGYHTVGFITSSIYNHFKSFRYYRWNHGGGDWATLRNKCHSNYYIGSAMPIANIGRVLRDNSVRHAHAWQKAPWDPPQTSHSWCA